jgi:hypothetical protein
MESLEIQQWCTDQFYFWVQNCNDYNTAYDLIAFQCRSQFEGSLKIGNFVVLSDCYAFLHAYSNLV